MLDINYADIGLLKPNRNGWIKCGPAPIYWQTVIMVLLSQN